MAEIKVGTPKYMSWIRSFYRLWKGIGAGAREEWGPGSTSFELEKGKVYEVNEPWKDRYFVKVENGKSSGSPLREVPAKL